MPRSYLLPTLTLIAFSALLPAQTQTAPDGVKQVQNAQEKGPLDAKDAQPLTVSSNVGDNVQVEAVLLPPDVTKHVFGGRISRGYAAVELIISNHSPTAAFVLESAFLDYSQWLLNGLFHKQNGAPVPDPNDSDPPNLRSRNDSITLRGQVASVEARLVRSDLQDHQPFTTRNLVTNGITAIGSIAIGYDFLATSMNYTRGIAAFQGIFAPAVAVLWPDQTQLQLNRISDFGFRTPHLVPKDSSDIVIAFYPLDRFLTPSLKKAFLKSPAIFFVPGSALADDKTRKFLLDPMRAFGVITEPDDDAAAKIIGPALLHDPGNCSASPAPTDDKNIEVCNIRAFVKGTSLNRIHLTVSGNMQVDLDAVPALITDIVLDQPKDAATTWEAASTTVRTGTILGSFLAGGTPSLVDPPDGFGPLTKDPDKSNDGHLAFSFKPTKNIPPDAVLSFVVTKRSKDGTTTSSARFSFIVPHYTPSAPQPPAPGVPAPAAPAPPAAAVAPAVPGPAADPVPAAHPVPAPAPAKKNKGAAK